VGALGHGASGGQIVNHPIINRQSIINDQIDNHQFSIQGMSNTCPGRMTLDVRRFACRIRAGVVS
jgi:hypothetical protein